MYQFIKSMYDRRMMTAGQVWAMAEGGRITERQAAMICGPRPE